MTARQTLGPYCSTCGLRRDNDGHICPPRLPVEQWQRLPDGSICVICPSCERQTTTLRREPVNRSGTLWMVCEHCRAVIVRQLDQYVTSCRNIPNAYKQKDR